MKFVKAMAMNGSEDVLISLHDVKKIYRANRAERFDILETRDGECYEVGWSNEKTYMCTPNYVVDI